VGRLWCTELIPDIEKFRIFAVLWWPFWKWRPVEIFQCWQSIWDIIIYPHIKFWWYRTMLNFCDIVAAILKMATARNFSMSGINLGHHNLATYQINFYRSPFSKWSTQYRTNSTLSDFNAISYVGRLWCTELIPDIEKFLPVSIFKMAATGSSLLFHTSQSQ
jgi:hypothetical protein